MSLIIWCIYSLFVGSIAKAIVPGEENMNMWQTIFLGVAGSYCGGLIMYAVGSYEQIEPSGIFMGIVGSVISLAVFNKVRESKKA